MRTHIASALIVFALLAAPLSADLSGITTKPLNFPSFASEMTIGSDGNIWMLTDKGKLGKLTPGGTYTEFALPWGVDQFGMPFAQTMASGIDANLWIVGLNGHIARVTTSGVATDFTVAPSLYPPPLIVSGADGALWFFDRPFPGPGASNAWKLGRIDIYGQVTTFDLGISNDQLRGLVSGGDGNLWFIDENKSQVVKFSIATKSVAGTFAIPSASNQDSDDQMVLGPDANVWFTRGTSIDRIKTDGTITEFHIPSSGKPAAIVTGGDGNIWFTEPSSSRIGQVVVSSITSGGSATINETGAILGDGYELFALPPGFANPSGKSGPLAVKPCPLITFIVRRSPPNSSSGNAAVVSTTAPTNTCADISVYLQFGQFREEFGFEQPPSAAIDVKNAGPDDAVNVTATFTLAEGSTINSVLKGTFASVSQSGTTLTFTTSLLVPGETAIADVNFLNPPLPNLSFGTLIAFSDTPDPDPKNNIAANVSVFDIGRRHVHAVEPDLSNLVITQVQRGK